MFNGLDYNVKADVFSFAMAMYELVHRRLILSTILEKHFGSSFEEKELALYEYASAVATQGYRCEGLDCGDKKADIGGSPQAAHIYTLAWTEMAFHVGGAPLPPHPPGDHCTFNA